MKSLATALSGLLFLGGCAVGVKHDYGKQALNLEVATPATVAVGTLDHRFYIVNGQKSPDFVGLSRGGFGNPFDVNTQSGQPLATDISNSIVESMKTKGMNARAIELKHTLSVDEAGSALRASGTQRAVMIRIQEWKSDTMINIGFHYDLVLRVLDGSGKVLASKVEQGSENLGSAGFEPGGGSQVLPRYRRMFEGILRQPDVVKALQP